MRYADYATRGQRVAQPADQRVRAVFRGIGRQDDTVSPPPDRTPEPHFHAALRIRLDVLAREPQSPGEFDGQGTDPVHSLLEARLGLINIE